jgi:hypothetical protein
VTLNLIRRSTKGNPLSAADHDGNLDALETAILAPRVRGQISRITSGNITGIVQSVYQSTGLTATFDTATANGTAVGTTDTFGVKNTSGSTRLMLCYGSIDAKDGNNITLGIKLALNGTPIDETECRAFTSSGAAEAKLVTNWIVSVPNNAEVSLLIANHTSTSDLELRRARLVLTEAF